MNLKFILYHCYDNKYVLMCIFIILDNITFFGYFIMIKYPKIITNKSYLIFQFIEIYIYIYT